MYYNVEQYQCIPAFSSPIVLSTLNEDLSALENIKKYTFDSTNVDSSQNSYKTDDNRILENFPKEKEIILKHFYNFKKLILKCSTDFVISTSWATKINSGGYSQYHNHKNSFYSGVFYFEDVENGGEIQFKNPMTEFGGFLVNTEEWNIFNYEVFHVQPKKNLLVLFPSYLSHKINLYAGLESRYSLAFNFAPVGIFGIGDSSVNYSFIEK
jgi:uncharacterized protein (TIGR02466 family)